MSLDIPRRSYLGTPATAPGPAGPQMLRHTFGIRSHPLRFLATMRDTYGDVVQFPIPRPPTYLIASAAGTTRVLVGNQRNYGKDTIQYRSLSLVTGNGLLTADDEQWRSQRPVVQPAFDHRGLPDLAEVVAIETQRSSRSWNQGEVLDVEPAMMDIALRVVGRVLFGDDLRGDSAQLAQATLAALSVVIQRSRVPVNIPKALPTPANRRLDQAMTQLDAAVQTLVQQRRAATAGDGSGGALLLDLLLRSDMTPDEVRNQVVTFLVAGHETAASGLTWALGLLAGAPDWQRFVAATNSVAEVFPVVDEALRLFPPAWVITRQSRGEDEVEGREIPAGALVILSPSLLHRDERYWSRPEVFDPARFLEAKPATMTAYLPFGRGMRLCIGRDFARWEMAVVLRELSRRFTFSRISPVQPRAMTEVTLRPTGGMPLRVTARG